MSNKNKKVVTMDAKVENQEKTAPVAPETPVEPEGTSATGEETGDEKEKKKFELPKIKFPKIPLPSKETALTWLKRIGLFLLGAITGAIGIVAAAQTIVKNREDEDQPEDETEDEIEEKQEDDIPDEPEEDPADEATEG